MREGVDCNGKKWTEYTKPYLKRYDITGEVFDCVISSRCGLLSGMRFMAL